MDHREKNQPLYYKVEKENAKDTPIVTEEERLAQPKTDRHKKQLQQKRKYIHKRNVADNAHRKKKQKPKKRQNSVPTCRGGYSLVLQCLHNVTMHALCGNTSARIKSACLWQQGKEHRHEAAKQFFMNYRHVSENNAIAYLRYHGSYDCSLCNGIDHAISDCPYLDIMSIYASEHPLHAEVDKFQERVREDCFSNGFIPKVIGNILCLDMPRDWCEAAMEHYEARLKEREYMRHRLADYNKKPVKEVLKEYMERSMIAVVAAAMNVQQAVATATAVASNAMVKAAEPVARVLQVIKTPPEPKAAEEKPASNTVLRGHILNEPERIQIVANSLFGDPSTVKFARKDVFVNGDHRMVISRNVKLGYNAFEVDTLSYIGVRSMFHIGPLPSLLLAARLRGTWMGFFQLAWLVLKLLPLWWTSALILGYFIFSPFKLILTLILSQLSLMQLISWIANTKLIWERQCSDFIPHIVTSILSEYHNHRCPISEEQCEQVFKRCACINFPAIEYTRLSHATALVAMELKLMHLGFQVRPDDSYNPSGADWLDHVSDSPPDGHNTDSGTALGKFYGKFSLGFLDGVASWDPRVRRYTPTDTVIAKLDSLTSPLHKAIRYVAPQQEEIAPRIIDNSPDTGCPTTPLSQETEETSTQCDKDSTSGLGEPQPLDTAVPAASSET
jgi:hypothetical protein